MQEYIRRNREIKKEICSPFSQSVRGERQDSLVPAYTHRRSLGRSPGKVPSLTGEHCFRCTCKAAPHAHVVLLHMYMSYCFTCTSKTKKHYDLRYIRLRLTGRSPQQNTDLPSYNKICKRELIKITSTGER